MTKTSPNRPGLQASAEWAPRPKGLCVRRLERSPRSPHRVATFSTSQRKCEAVSPQPAPRAVSTPNRTEWEDRSEACSALLSVSVQWAC